MIIDQLWHDERQSFGGEHFNVMLKYIPLYEKTWKKEEYTNGDYLFSPVYRGLLGFVWMGKNENRNINKV